MELQKNSMSEHSAAVDESQDAEQERHEFRALIRRVRAGSQEAGWELVERYASHILRVVRRRLSREIRPKFDSMDFVQAVWMSFFNEPGKICSFDRPEALVAFLATVARNKVIEENRRRLEYRKHAVKNECSLEKLTEHGFDAFGHHASPSQFAMARERWEEMVEQLPEKYRQMIQLRYEGMSLEEIAAVLGVNERTVRRLFQRIADADAHENQDTNDD